MIRAAPRGMDKRFVYVLKDNETAVVKEAASLGFGTTTIQLMSAKAH